MISNIYQHGIRILHLCNINMFFFTRDVCILNTHTHVCRSSSVVCPRDDSRSSWLFTAFGQHDVAVASLHTRAPYRAAKPGRVPCCLQVGRTRMDGEKISVMGMLKREGYGNDGEK